ncbi:MAG: hypothetical protein Q8R04_00245 [Nanoarchaeota archaeon]|nr:hypothetical protein [Nanoarchaeota archaeon]
MASNDLLIPNKESLVRLIDEEILALQPFLVRVGIDVDSSYARGALSRRKFHIFYSANNEENIRGTLQLTREVTVKEILAYIRSLIPDNWNVVETGKTEIPYKSPMEYLQITPRGSALEESFERLTT